MAGRTCLLNRLPRKRHKGSSPFSSAGVVGNDGGVTPDCKSGTRKRSGFKSLTTHKEELSERLQGSGGRLENGLL